MEGGDRVGWPVTIIIMKSIKLNIALGVIVGLMLSVFGAFVTNTRNVDGAAFTGTASNVRMSTTTVVGPQGSAVVKTQVFAANAACKSRIITTDGTSAIRISFKDIPTSGNIGSTTVGATVGHLQLASTTVEYDSGIYGCGTWNIWAWASTTLSVTETQ